MSPVLKFAGRPPLKLLLLGDGGVGKTTLVRAFTKKPLKKDYLMTVGVDISTKEVALRNHRIEKVAISDVAGQARFEHFRSVFFNGANLTFFVYDVTRRDSIENLGLTWLEQLIPTVQDPNFCAMIIANKIDLEDEREINPSEGKIVLKRFERNYKMIKWIGHIETSALTRENVDEAFTTIVQTYYDLISEKDLKIKKAAILPLQKETEKLKIISAESKNVRKKVMSKELKIIPKKSLKNQKDIISPKKIVRTSKLKIPNKLKSAKKVKKAKKPKSIKTLRRKKIKKKRGSRRKKRLKTIKRS